MTQKGEKKPVKKSQIYSQSFLDHVIFDLLFQSFYCKSTKYTQPVPHVTESSRHLPFWRDRQMNPQHSRFCFKVISVLSIWCWTPQAAPAEGGWAKQWPFHGECDSYISSFTKQRSASCVLHQVLTVPMSSSLHNSGAAELLKHT